MNNLRFSNQPGMNSGRLAPAHYPKVQSVSLPISDYLPRLVVVTTPPSLELSTSLSSFISTSQEAVVELYCPFTASLNPQTAAVHQASLKQAVRLGIEQRLAKANLAELIGYAYPTLDRELFQLIVDWTIFMYLLDDRYDESAVGQRPEQIVAELERLASLMVLEGEAAATTFPVEPGCGVPGAELAELKKAEDFLKDLWERLRSRSSAEWQQRFRQTFRRTLGGAVEEARNRLSGKIPGLREYIELRAITSSLDYYWEFIELSEAEAGGLPGQLRNNYYLQRLARQANNIVSWHNDLFSYPREQAKGDVHNLVIVLGQEYPALTTNEAFRASAALVNSEMQSYLSLESQLLQFNFSAPGLKGEVERYCEVMRGWISGNLVWSQGSSRFHRAGLSTQKEDNERLDACYPAASYLTLETPMQSSS